MKTCRSEGCQLKEAGDKKYYCYFELTLQVIGGKWKPIILYHLGANRVMRFAKFKKAIPNITEKMLIQQLRALEADGLVHRKVYRQVPPKVEYSLTELGLSIVPILNQLRAWGIHYEQSLGLHEKFEGDVRFEQPKDLLEPPTQTCDG